MRIVDLRKLGRSLEIISKQLEIISSNNCTNVIWMFHHFFFLLKEDTNCHERKLVRMLRNNRGNEDQACHELETAGRLVSLSTVKRVLYRHALRECQPRKKP